MLLTRFKALPIASIKDASVQASFLLALLAATATNLPKGPVLACALMLLVALCRAGDWQLGSHKGTWRLAAVFFLAALSGLTHLFVDGWHALDTPLRYLLALPVVFWLSGLRLQAAPVFAGCVLGAVLSGAYALYQQILAPETMIFEGRADGIVHRVFTFGTLVTVQAALCVCAAVYFDRRGRRVAAVLSLVGAAMGILGCFLSATRGAWVALPPTMLLLVILFSKRCQLRHLLAVGAATVLVAGLALATFPPFKARSLKVWQDLVAYSEGHRMSYRHAGGEDGNSVGMRLEMWRAAVRAFQESPLTGLSFKERAGFNRQLIGEGYGLVPGDGTGSAHNEVFDALSKRGLLGLVAILLLYLVPARHFLRCWRQCRQSADKAIPAAGLAVIAVYAVSGLTERFLYSHREAMFYAFMLAGLWCMSAQLDVRPAVEAEPA